MAEDGSRSLLSVSPAQYGNLYREHVFQQYKLYVESADHISQRRSSTNSFFLAVNVSLVTLYGLASSLAASEAWRLLVPIAGILVSLAWVSLVTSYRNLNSAKFMVIHELEKNLPVYLYRHEWHLLGKGEGKIYKPVSHIEQSIPIVFALLYVGLILYSLIPQLLKTS